MSFVPAHSVVEGSESGEGPLVFIVHGILGSGRNWRTFARRLARSAPRARFALIDLRNHGDSDGAPPPHTVRTTADDLAALADEIGHPSVVIGHSFGGKVAASYALHHGAGLHRVWVLDSRLDAYPVEPDNEVAAVLRALRGVPQPLDSREALVAHLGEAGFSVALSQWMTTNLQRADDGLRWAFDLAGVEQMIDDYWRCDLTAALSDATVPLSLVRAGKGDRWTQALVERYRASAHPGVTFHVLPDAGHWVHVDDPVGLARLLVPSITEAPTA